MLRSTKIVALDANIFAARNGEMLTPAQCRSARGWLNWTQAELAKEASVGLSTLRDFEAEIRTPIQNNLAAIRRALEEGGGAAFLKATDALGEGPSNQRPAPSCKKSAAKRRS